MHPLLLGRLDKRDLLVLVLLALVFLTYWFGDFGPVTTWVLLGGGILLGPLGCFGWRWRQARLARAEAHQEALFLNEAFLGQIACLPKADQEKLLRNLAQTGSRQPTLRL